VPVDGVLAQEKLLGDVGVAQSLRDKLEHVELAGRQQRGGLGSPCRRRLPGRHPVPGAVQPPTSARTAASSASRPMKLDTCAGRLWNSSGPSSGLEAGKPAITPPPASQRHHPARPRSAAAVPSRRNL
jgi:hypothetical protein